MLLIAGMIKAWQYVTVGHYYVFQLSDVLSMNELAVDDDGNDNFVRRYMDSINSPDKIKLTAVPVVDVDELEMPPPVEFDREELLYILRDFFLGGTDTSVITIRWFLIMMANHRDVQLRMQEEIDDVVGRDRLPSMDDERAMPYSQAVILETMRRYTLAPLSLFHSTTCDTAVKDVFVPANTMVC